MSPIAPTTTGQIQPQTTNETAELTTIPITNVSSSAQTLETSLPTVTAAVSGDFIQNATRGYPDTTWLDTSSPSTSAPTTTPEARADTSTQETTSRFVRLVRRRRDTSSGSSSQNGTTSTTSPATTQTASTTSTSPSTTQTASTSSTSSSLTTAGPTTTAPTTTQTPLTNSSAVSNATTSSSTTAESTTMPTSSSSTNNTSSSTSTNTSATSSSSNTSSSTNNLSTWIALGIFACVGGVFALFMGGLFISWCYFGRQRSIQYLLIRDLNRHEANQVNSALDAIQLNLIGISEAAGANGTPLDDQATDDALQLALLTVGVGEDSLAPDVEQRRKLREELDLLCAMGDESDETKRKKAELEALLNQS